MGNRNKPKKNSRMLWLLTGTILLAGCNYKEQGKVIKLAATANPASISPGKVEPAEAIPTLTPTSDPQSLEIEAYWQKFAPQILGKMSIDQGIEEKPLHYYEAGLRNSNPLIRWFCIYKLTDYADRLTDSDHQTINALLEDQDPDVQKAASFAKSLLEGTFEGEAFERSANEKIVAYYKYREARYNDGKVFLVQEGVTRMIAQAPSVTLLTISPNNRFLFIENGGRIWTGVQVTDLSLDTEVPLPKLVMDIIGDPKNGYGTEIDPTKIARFEDWVHFKEWSPEGDRLLYSYQFMDEKSEAHAGFTVLDLNHSKITRVYPRKPDQDALADFSWETI